MHVSLIFSFLFLLSFCFHPNNDICDLVRYMFLKLECKRWDFLLASVRKCSKIYVYICYLCTFMRRIKRKIKLPYVVRHLDLCIGCTAAMHIL